MAYNFLSLYTEVGTQFDTVAASSGRTKLWVNDSVHEIISMRRWSFLESMSTFASVSGNADYVLIGASPLVTDFDGIISVRHNQAAAGTTFPKLKFLKQQELDDNVGIAGATPGIPVYYTIRGGAPQTSSASILAGGNQTMSVWPVPNFVGSFKVSYFRSVASVEMTSDSDIPLLPVPFKQAIVLLAVARGKAVTDQLIASNVAAQSAQQVLQALEQADLAARGGDPSDDVPTISGRLPASPAVANPQQSPYGYKVEG